MLKQVTGPTNSDNYACVRCVLFHVLQEQTLTESKDGGSPAAIHPLAVLPKTSEV